MKHTKKLASLLLALALAFALAVPAFAESETGSITINDAVVGQTYTIYQILDLESYNASANAYAYKAATAWSAFINDGAIKGVYVNVDAQGYVTCKDGADAAAFAKAAQKYAKENNSIANQGSVTATTTTVSFNGLDLGYYLVDTTLGTLCSLDTTNPNVEMYEKNEVPTNVKTVEEDSNNTWGSKDDADIGQTVNFKSTITAQKGAQNYIFHDEMSAGLTLNDASIKVYTLSGEVETELDTANYVIKTENTCKTDCDFEVHFTQSYLDTISDATTIVIKYSATLNENAKVGVEGNPNKSYLDYGTNPSDETKPGSTTPPSTTTTYTWDMDVLKYANGDESKVLKDAQFVLLNKDTTKVATVVNGKITGWVDVPNAGQDGSIPWPENTVLTTGENGKIEIDGLDADTYYLREVQAPAGYNKIVEDVEVVITGSTTGENGNLTYTTVLAKVNNQSGTELPSTGGMGTTIFYVLGGVLVVGAVVLLITKKRMGAEQ